MSVADTMRAAVFAGEGRLVIENVPVPTLKHDDDVLLRVRAVGICGSDVHILSVPPRHPATKGVILGHEYVADVEAVGEAVTHVAAGDRVVVDPTPPCGICAYCQMDQPNMCENNLSMGVFTHGGMAAYSRVPARAVFRISPDVPDDQAVLAEPIADVLNGIRRAAPRLGETVLVLGAGPIGLLFTLLLRAAGVGKILVSEVAPLRAKRAVDCGADVVINPAAEDLAAAVHREAPRGADLVIDAVGKLLGDALRTVRKGGRVLLFGVDDSAQISVRQVELTVNELSILGSYIDRLTFPQAIRLLESRRIDFSKLVTHRLPLGRVAEGVDLLRRGEGVKVVVSPE